MEQNYVTVTLCIGLSMTLCVRSVCLKTRSLANAEGSREHAMSVEIMYEKHHLKKLANDLQPIGASR